MKRISTKLLKTVNGKPHATEDDHESSDVVNAGPLPTPPDSARNSRSKRKSGARQPAADAKIIDEEAQTVNQKKTAEKDDEDFLRDPVSSSDEAEDMAGRKRDTAGKAPGLAKISKGARTEEKSEKVQPLRGLHKTLDLDRESPPVSKPSLQLPSVSSASIRDAPKREYTDAELEASDDEDWVRQSQQPKKKRKPLQNIHAGSAALVQPKRKLQKVFGSQNEKNERVELALQNKKKKEFERLHSTIEPTQPAPVFKRAQVGDMPVIQGSHTIAGAEDDVRPSERTPSPEQDSSTIVCETCQERVNKLLREEYSDDYVKGKSWNIQWQERFCEWHRAQTAKEVWRDRGYPTIDWTDLERRMQQHDKFLLSVLRNQEKSHYRDDYAAKVKAKSMSNGFKDAAVKPGATVGYYGPKGEKAMSEHVLSGLSEEIRKRAKTDRLVSPSGYQGGISGFVQGVLVPHLAELMIKEDMQLTGRDWAARAREVIAESAEVGELLHSDVRDRGHGADVDAEAERGDDWMLE